jgi:hypothetical protein
LPTVFRAWGDQATLRCGETGIVIVNLRSAQNCRSFAGWKLKMRRNRIKKLTNARFVGIYFIYIFQYLN